MNPHERKQAQEEFRTAVQICVATEAAGEGINLQFCHLMINYDLPWNPTRLEQRLGRIHRIGQKRDCLRLQLRRHRLGGRPADHRGPHPPAAAREARPDARGARGTASSTSSARCSRSTTSTSPRCSARRPTTPAAWTSTSTRSTASTPSGSSEYEQATGIALARANVDFSGFQYAQPRDRGAAADAQLRRGALHLSAAKEVGLRVEPRADGLWRIEHVLADLRSDRLHSVRRFGKAEPSYRKITFHKEHLDQNAHLDAVLIGPGHPLYAAVDERLNERLAPLVGRAAFYVDPPRRQPVPPPLLRDRDQGEEHPRRGPGPLRRAGGRPRGVRAVRDRARRLPAQPPGRIPRRRVRSRPSIPRPPPTSSSGRISANAATGPRRSASTSRRSAATTWRRRSTPASSAPASGT